MLRDDYFVTNSRILIQFLNRRGKKSIWDTDKIATAVFFVFVGDYWQVLTYDCSLMDSQFFYVVFKEKGKSPCM
jgi:hypothetical protein